MFVETVNSCLINVLSLQSQMTSIAFNLHTSLRYTISNTTVHCIQILNYVMSKFLYFKSQQKSVMSFMSINVQLMNNFRSIQTITDVGVSEYTCPHPFRYFALQRNELLGKRMLLYFSHQPILSAIAFSVCLIVRRVLPLVRIDIIDVRLRMCPKFFYKLCCSAQ